MRKRILAAGLIFAMLISSGTNVSYTEAKGKTALAKKAITLRKGKTFILKLKNNTKKVKWSVNKKKIIKLSKKTKKSVTLKALKPGKAKVTAKVGKKKYTCKVTVSAKGKNQQSATPIPDNSQSVPQISRIPTTTKLPTETTVPGVQTTQTPDINNTATPDVKATQTPDINNTATPDVKETQTPDVNNTATPDVKVTQTPDINNTATPDVKATQTPDINNTATPDVKETQTPDVNNTATPDVKETEKPMESPAVTPEVPSTATPTSVPEVTEDPTGKTVTIRGTVTDADGTLLSGVKVCLGQPDEEGEGYNTRFTAITDENGVYTVSGVKKGENYRARIYGINLYEDKPEIKITAGEKSTYDIKVQKTMLKVSGKLVDAEGKAVANLTVGVYESSEERQNGAYPKNQFVSGEDGTYSVWLEKNKDYYLKVSGNGNEYFPEKIQANSANQDIQISESLVLVEGTVKDKAGTVYKNETVALSIKENESDTQGYRTSLKTNDNGKFCMSIREDAVCNAELIIEGVGYEVGTITAGNKSTYDLLLDGEIETVNLNLVYANQKEVDEFFISGYMYRDGKISYLTGSEYGGVTGKDGTCKLRLKKDDLWHLEVYVHGETCSLEDVRVGDESTYNKQLDISFKKVSGTVTQKNGTTVPEAKVSFYKSVEMNNYPSKSASTDENGVYEVWLEEDVTYYVSITICGETYKIGKLEDNYNFTLDVNLENVELEVKNSDGTEYPTWSLYRNDNGKKGGYLGIFNKTTNLLLEPGKKYYVEIVVGLNLFTTESFIAGSFTVGDANTYKITVDEITVSGVVKTSDGTILTSANIVGTNDWMDSQVKYKVRVYFKNTIDGTQQSTIVGGEDGKYTIKLIKGQEYSVTVSVAGKTYETGTIVADKDKEQNITIDAKLAAIHGKITDVNDEIIKAKKVCFYEDEAYNNLVYEGGVNEDGTYGLYVEPGKTYYVRAAVPEGDYEYASSYEYVPLGSITVTEDNDTYDLKSSKMCVSGKVTDADGNALSYCNLQYYASESDSDYDKIASKRTGSNGQYTIWIEPGTYDVRASVPDSPDSSKWYSVGVLDTSDAATYDKMLQMRRIKGKITGVSKEALKECDLRLYEEENADDSNYIDRITPEADGTYQTKIYVKDDTRYFLCFGDDVYESVGSILSGDASTYDITMDKPFEKVSGKATFADGSPIKDGSLYLYDKESGNDRKCVAGYSIYDDEGKFETGYLQTGTTYYCEFGLDGVRYKSGSITVGKTDSYDQSIDKTLKKVSVTVKDAGGTVLDDITIKIKEDTDAEESEVICYGETSEEGVFKTEYLEVGKTYVASAKVCGKEYKTDTFTVDKDEQYEVKTGASFVKANGTVKKADNNMVSSGYIYLYESSEDDKYDYNGYAYISNGEYSNLRLESGKTYYVRVDDYSQSGYQNAGVITGGDASTYDITIQE